MLFIITVKFLISDLTPQNEVCILNAVGWRSRGLSQRAQWKFHLRREKPKCTLKAGCHARVDDPGVASQTLSTPIDHWFDRLLFHTSTLIELCRNTE